MGTEPLVRAADADAIAAHWSETVFALWDSGPESLLRAERDPFRNPVGATVREGLRTLATEVLGEMRDECIRQAMDDLAHVLAVQPFERGSALGFVDGLPAALASMEIAITPLLAARIETFAGLAAAAYDACRDKIESLRNRPIAGKFRNAGGPG